MINAIDGMLICIACGNRRLSVIMMYAKAKHYIDLIQIIC